MARAAYDPPGGELAHIGWACPNTVLERLPESFRTAVGLRGRVGWGVFWLWGFVLSLQG